MHSRRCGASSTGGEPAGPVTRTSGTEPPLASPGRADAGALPAARLRRPGRHGPTPAPAVVAVATRAAACSRLLRQATARPRPAVLGRLLCGRQEEPDHLGGRIGTRGIGVGP